MSADRPVILVLCDYYLPGYKGGGGLRTIVNMVERLGDEFDFRIITKDHDAYEDGTAYDSVAAGVWTDQGNAKVFYIPGGSVWLLRLRSLISETAPDAIYVNSFFSRLTRQALMLSHLRLITEVPILVAPCGELSTGALLQKPWRKRLFLGLAAVTGLFKGAIWKASSKLEETEIRGRVRLAKEVLIAPDLTPGEILGEFDVRRKPAKTAGRARMVFVSRFARKKNLHFLLEVLARSPLPLDLDVIGPIGDEGYRRECDAMIEELPADTDVRFKGPIAFEKVAECLFGYHFFVLPTLGENFGHVFVEALAAGCPLVISDRTPWRSLRTKNAGWDLSLDEPEAWHKALAHCIEMGQEEYNDMSRSARETALAFLQDRHLEEDTARVLRRAVSLGRG